MARTRNTTAPVLAKVRISASRMQRQGQRIVARLRHDAQDLIARSRSEVVKEVRDLERKLVKTLHAATSEQVARLERRVAKLEQTIVAMQRPAPLISEAW